MVSWTVAINRFSIFDDGLAGDGCHTTCKANQWAGCWCVHRLVAVQATRLRHFQTLASAKQAALVQCHDKAVKAAAESQVYQVIVHISCRYSVGQAA